MAEKRQTNAPVHDHHGNSVANWTGVIIVALGFLLMTIGVVSRQWTLFYVGAPIALVGGIVGKVLAMMGFGADDRANH